MKEQVLSLLINRIKECTNDKDLKQLTLELRNLFLSSWSETPDNLETSKYLSIGRVENPYTNKKETGLILESQNELISTILWQAFGDSTIPEEVQKNYPTLTKEEWNQILRISQFALSLFEVEK